MDRRIIIDEAGIDREMELIFECDGTSLYRELGGIVVCLFTEYDSLDEDGDWHESIGNLIDSHPQWSKLETLES